MQSLNVLGIIPARGGSKGVPRKNIRPLAGQPLIVHTIEAALQSSTLDRVIVSTDDEEIAEVARRAGAEVPFIRPARFASDTASSLSVLKHALEWLREHQDYSPDALAVLPPTSPLRTKDQIDATVDSLWSSGMDSAVTVTEVQDHPYFIFSRSPIGQMQELMPMDNKPLRRQELPDYYAHSQSVVVSRSSYLDRCQDPDPAINFLSMAGYKIDRQSALDIDTETDFLIAEMLFGKQLRPVQKVA